MKFRRPLACLIAGLWLFVLISPLGRTELWLMVPGVNGPPAYDPLNWGQISAELPDPSTLINQYPDAAENQVELLGAYAHGVDPLDDMARNDVIPEQLAAVVMRHGADLQISRSDNPVDDGNWPIVNYISGFMTGDDTPRLWTEILPLAQQGAQLEPDNSFWDWQEMAALIALGRDAEASHVLKLAAAKPRYEDHSREELATAFAVCEWARPLLPSEQLDLRQANAHSYIALDEVSNTIMGHVIALRLSGRDQEAINMADELLKLGRAMRRDCPFLDGSAEGARIEQDAIKNVYAPPAPNGYRYYPDLPPASLLLQSPNNLASYAASANRPEVAKEAVAEDAAAGAWLTAVMHQESGPPPVRGAFTADTAQFAWRLLVAGLLPLGLLLAVVWFLARSAPKGAPGHYGICAVGLALASICAAFVVTVLAERHHLNNYEILILPAKDSSARPCYETAPRLVAGLVATVFLVLALTEGRRWQNQNSNQPSWNSRLRGMMKHGMQPREMDVRPLIGLTVFWTLWLLPWIALNPFRYHFFYKLNQYTYSYMALPDFPQFCACCLASFAYLLLVPVVKWLRAPHAADAIPHIAASFRGLLIPYITTILLLYPISALLVLRVETHFTSEYAAYLQRGETASLRQELGFK